MQKPYRVFVPILALLTLTVPLGATLAEPPVDPAHVTVGVHEAVDGCAEWDTEELIKTVAYQETFNHYDDLPGFVDLIFLDEAEPKLVALFDADHRGLALPEPTAPVHGIPIYVEETRFEPLMTPWETDTAGNTLPLPPIPGACSGIQPGARISTVIGGCSTNFVFTDQNGIYYIGTAGHCGPTGSRVNIGNHGSSGTIIYSTGNGGVGTDFAMIRIDDDKQDLVDPSMCYWGGPTEVAGVGGGRAVHYGYPVIYSMSHLTRPRVGEISSSGGTNSFSFMGLVASGDSGSGARHEHGGALGTVTHVNVPLLIFAHSGPYAFGTKVDRGLGLAEAATGLDFEIVTAPIEADLPL